jgi:hypothetical protein
MKRFIGLLAALSALELSVPAKSNCTTSDIAGVWGAYIGSYACTVTFYSNGQILPEYSGCTYLEKTADIFGSVVVENSVLCQFTGTLVTESPVAGGATGIVLLTLSPDKLTASGIWGVENINAPTTAVSLVRVK